MLNKSNSRIRKDIEDDPTQRKSVIDLARGKTWLWQPTVALEEA